MNQSHIYVDLGNWRRLAIPSLELTFLGDLSLSLYFLYVELIRLLHSPSIPERSKDYVVRYLRSDVEAAKAEFLKVAVEERDEWINQSRSSLEKVQKVRGQFRAWSMMYLHSGHSGRTPAANGMTAVNRLARTR